MGDHLAFSGGLLQAPLNPVKTDISRGPPGLSGGPGPSSPTIIRPLGRGKPLPSYDGYTNILLAEFVDNLRLLYLPYIHRLRCCIFAYEREGL